MKDHELLHFAALLHDIGKFRQRATDRYKPHQEHSYEFVNEDFADFFAPCGDAFKNAIRYHHALRRYQSKGSANVDREQLQFIDKQVILADQLSATEREDEERDAEDFVESALVSPLSRLKCATKDHRYPLTELNLDRDTVIPTESADVNQETYADLWEKFTTAFHKVTQGIHYTPASYQTVVALLHRYTSRMPSSTPWEQEEKKTVPDISLYDHLRTTAAIAACIGRELSEADVDTLLTDTKDSNKKISALIKGDLSGIQNFLYHVLSDGAANQLRGRSFYLQLLIEAIAHYVLKQFDLPITNLIHASGGHFYILAPYTETKTKLDTIRRNIAQKLWELHKGDLSCILAGISIKARDFGPENFPDKWKDVSEKVQERKQQKWAEMGPQQMFEKLFEPRAEPFEQKEKHGETLNFMDGCYVDSRWYHINLDKVLAHPNTDINALTSAISQRDFRWHRYLSQRNMDPSEFSHYGLSCPQSPEEVEIREAIKTVGNHPYIPGSTIKGALRTVLLGEKLIKSNEVFHKSEAELTHIINQRPPRNPRTEQPARKIENFAFGKDPNHDILRALQISDTAPLKTDAMAIGIAWTVTLNRNDELVPKIEGQREFKNFIQYIQEKQRFTFTLKIDDLLFRKREKTQLSFSDLQEKIVRTFAQNCRALANDLMEAEFEFFDIYEFPRIVKVYDKLIDLNNRLPKNAFLLQIGWGTGYHANTVTGLFANPSQSQENRWGKIRERFKLGESRSQRRHYDEREFPKTRRILYRGQNPIAPLGWVKISPLED